MSAIAASLSQAAVSVPALSRHVYDLHRDLQGFEGVRIPRPAAGQRRGLVLLARHRDESSLPPVSLVFGGSEAVPTRAGDVDFGPGMRGAMLALAHLDV